MLVAHSTRRWVKSYESSSGVTITTLLSSCHDRATTPMCLPNEATSTSGTHSTRDMWTWGPRWVVLSERRGCHFESRVRLMDRSCYAQVDCSGLACLQVRVWAPDRLLRFRLAVARHTCVNIAHVSNWPPRRAQLIHNRPDCIETFIYTIDPLSSSIPCQSRNRRIRQRQTCRLFVKYIIVCTVQYSYASWVLLC